MSKKGHEEEHENHERWLVSYADFITLLFAFFVVMYSVSRVDTKRLAKVLESVKFALHYQGAGGVAHMPVYDAPPSVGGCVAGLGNERGASITRIDPVEPMRRHIEKRVRQVIRAIKDTDHAVIVVVEGNRLTVRLSARRFFDAGSATVRPEMIPVLQSLASELGKLHREVQVGGHTSETLRVGGPFRSDWELSTMRATAVTRLLERSKQFGARDLSAVGFADTRPLYSDPTPAARESNRRVELTVELRPADELARLGG